MSTAASLEKQIQWTLADLNHQAKKWDSDEVSVHNRGQTLEFRRADGTSLAIIKAADTGLEFEVNGQNSAFRWASTISEWVQHGSTQDLYGQINTLLRGYTGLVLEPISMLRLDGLKTYFHTEQGVVKAVDGLTVKIPPGSTLGLVGESGSGKSVTSLSVMGLLPEFTARIPEGEVVFMGQDLLSFRMKEMRTLRGADMAMIFQEPMTSLNPVYRVGDQVAESILLHEGVSKDEAKRRALELFREVGIPDPETRLLSYPHEMSGGQKQRVMIAMALACNPSLLIADEPTTALDVTIQKQILDLLCELRDTRGMSILFITHDLGVIAEIADDVAVMYRGKLCEYGDVVSVFENPAHPYTRGLLACRPRLDSPYQLLPTVSDFLDTWVEDGEIRVKEKAITHEREQELLYGGREKLIKSDSEPVLQVNDLRVWFPIKKNWAGKVTKWVKAVDDISFSVYPGQTLGLVGESGCGKTTTGRSILRLVNPTAGRTVFMGEDLNLLEGDKAFLKKALFTGAVACFFFVFLTMGAWLSQAIEFSTQDPSEITTLVRKHLDTAGIEVTGVSENQQTGQVEYTYSGTLSTDQLLALGISDGFQNREEPAAIDVSGVTASTIAPGVVTVTIPSMTGLSFSLPIFAALGLILGLGLSGLALGRISEKEKEIRRKLQIIFQDPYASLNPRRTVEQTIVEPMTVHGLEESHAARVKRAGDLLEEVGLPREYLRRYPHEFSGGQRQRICIARTLALNPSMIICDESVSALDVSVQAQVLNLLKKLQMKYGLTYIFISHDLSVVKFMSDIMAVMKDGKIVEIGPSDEIYADAKDTYTQTLISAIPKDDIEYMRTLHAKREAARANRRESALRSA